MNNKKQIFVCWKKFRRYYQIDLVLLLVTTLVFAASHPLLSQVSQVEYGKNRVQFNDDFDEWIYFESQNFVTYFYGKSRPLGYKTVQYAEKDFEELIKLLEFKLNDKLDILVFSDLNDIKQSNIGISEAFILEKRKVKVEGNRIFVFYNGDMNNLRTQIREGIAEAFIQNMFYGAEWKQALQNNNTPIIPNWFVDGLVSYIGDRWTIEDDYLTREVFLHQQYKNFNRWMANDGRTAGKAFWKYIADFHGEIEIPNILYVARINKNIESSFLYVLGNSFENEINKMWEYYSTFYLNDEAKLASISIKNDAFYKAKRGFKITQIEENKENNLAAMVLNHMDKTFVKLLDLKSKKTKNILCFGHRNNVQQEDFQMPLIAWAANHKALGVVFNKRDRWWFYYYDLKEKKARYKIKLPEKLQRIFAFDFDENKGLVLSALGEQFTDLYYYNIKNNSIENLTNDIFDDLDVKILNFQGAKGLVFSSNRPDTELKKVIPDTILVNPSFDLFYYQLDAKWPQLQRLSETPQINERKPRQNSSTELGYLTDQTGIKSLLVSSIDGYDKLRFERILLRDGTYRIISSTDTIPKSWEIERQEPLSILQLRLENQFFSKLNTPVYAFSPLFLVSEIRGRSFVVSAKDSLFVSADSVQLTAFMQEKRSPTIKQLRPDQIKIKPYTKPKDPFIESLDTLSETNPNLYFQTPFDNIEQKREETPFIINGENPNQTPIIENTSNVPEILNANGLYRIDPLKVVPYRLRFRLLDFNTTIDNNPLFGGLNSFINRPSDFNTAPLGILAKAKWKDLLENYIFEGGVRIPTSFNGSEIFLTFEDLKHRFDHQYTLYRKVLNENIGSSGIITYRAKTVTLLGQYTLKYAFDVHQSLRAISTIRQDKFTPLASDFVSLEAPDLLNQRLGIQLSYVYDNSIDVDININYGTKAKIYLETIKPLSVNLGTLDFDFQKGYTGILGMDIRHFLRLDRHSILAGRFAGAYSFGTERILHYIGGTDNWLFPRFNSNIPHPVDVALAYQVTAPNLRGFEYNIRNGTTYGIFNIELRVPFLKYLSQKPLRSAFLRSIQAVGFLDGGTAWTGPAPFNNKNPSNTVLIENPPSIYLKVNYYRNPIVLGYGFGMRANIFGYFLRADYAWGIETNKITSPRFHLSMGLDF
jgi:hypothetical protein